MLFSEVRDDGSEVDVFFLHLLMMASTLFRLAGPYEHLHTLENLIHSSHMPVYEVTVVDLQKPMITLVLLQGPMTTIHAPGFFRALPSSFLPFFSRRKQRKGF